MLHHISFIIHYKTANCYEVEQHIAIIKIIIKKKPATREL